MIEIIYCNDRSDKIKKSIEALNSAGIKFEYRQQCAKYYAVIKLTSGLKIMFCCFTGKLLYRNKIYNKNNRHVPGLIRFMEVNKLEVAE